jgi:hypothetical protein
MRHEITDWVKLRFSIGVLVQSLHFFSSAYKHWSERTGARQYPYTHDPVTTMASSIGPYTGRSNERRCRVVR